MMLEMCGSVAVMLSCSRGQGGLGEQRYPGPSRHKVGWVSPIQVGDSYRTSCSVTV